MNSSICINQFLATDVTPILQKYPLKFRSVGKVKSENFTRLFDEYKTKLSNYCMSTNDFEEMYGNISRFASVLFIGSNLCQIAYRQIGQNELRQLIGLKRQQIRYGEFVKEEPEYELNQTTLSPLLQSRVSLWIYALNRNFLDMISF